MPMFIPISDDEIKTLIRLAKKVIWCDESLKQQIQNAGVHIAPANFYSELPTVQEINDSFEFREIETGAFNNSNIFNKQRLENFMHVLENFSSEFDVSEEGDQENPSSYFWRNPYFSFSDAMAYYCMIRHLKPKQVTEIGSGFSTLVADKALQKNGYGELVIIEPYPATWLKKISTVKTIEKSFIQNIKISNLIDIAQQGEILFIDSTHTVKHGSDCLYIYLKLMPNLNKKMMIHSHDIHLPFPFSRQRLIEKNITWTEQYLLYAYLLDNPKTEVVFSSAYSMNQLPEVLLRFMKGKFKPGGGSIWYTRNPEV